MKLIIEPQSSSLKTPNDYLTIILSVGFLLSFVLLGILNTPLLEKLVNGGFAFAIKYFGAFWQVLLLLTFFIGFS